MRKQVLVPLVACVAILIAAGPAISREARVQMQTNFLTAEHDPYLAPGTGTVVGQAFFKRADGAMATCAGRKAMILPATSFVKEMVSIMQSGGQPVPPSMKGVGRKYARLLEPRQSPCDKEGRFTFKDVPAGEWYISVRFHLGRSGLSEPFRNLVSVSLGEASRISVTAFADGTEPVWRFTPSRPPSPAVATRDTQVELPLSVGQPIAPVAIPPISVPEVEPPMPLPRPASFARTESIRKDIDLMKADPLKKTGWESDADFLLRKPVYLAKYQKPRGYRLSLKMDNPENIRPTDGSYQLAYYDLDAGQLVVALRSDAHFRKTFDMDASGDALPSVLTPSFIETDREVVSTVRTMRNGLGISTNVREIRGTAYGVAILGGRCAVGKEGWYIAGQQQAFIEIGREAARDVLAAGTVVIDVALETRFWQHTETPFVYDLDQDFHGATISEPYERVIDRRALAVRPLSVQILSSSGRVIARGDCTDAHLE